VLKIEMMPASYGDCILLQYGTARTRHRVLIDGGLEGNWRRLRDRLAAFGQPCMLDLLVITHIDADHIGGIVKMLEQAPETIDPQDVWFNGREQLEEFDDRFGEAQGERLSQRIAQLRWPHNQPFGGKAVVVRENQELPVVSLPGGATITLLSPGPRELSRLLAHWPETLARAGILDGEAHLGASEEAESEGGITADDRLGDRVRELADSEFDEDDARANGSSIAFLFEWNEKRVLFGADAFPSVLRHNLAKLGQERVELDAFKVPHHGSRKNLDTDLLDVIECPRYLISTNGARFGHPSDEAIARILVHDRPAQKQLLFNYTSDRNQHWASSELQDKYGYEAVYPAPDEEGIVLML
jgi:beta-lactamase superfamily II metal-dependent hydrolase